MNQQQQNHSLMEKNVQSPSAKLNHPNEFKIKQQQQPRIGSSPKLKTDGNHLNLSFSTNKKEKREFNKSSVNNFIQKTFNILQSRQYESIVSWNESNDSLVDWNGSSQPLIKALNCSSCSFKIHNLQLFEKIVLPRYFKHSNMGSFVRQLNMYNFHKIRGDKNEYEFEHEKFIRNRQDLLPQIKRKNPQSQQSIKSVGLIPASELRLLEPRQSQYNNSQKQIGRNEGQEYRHPKQSQNIISQCKLNISQELIQQSPERQSPQGSSNDFDLSARLFELQQINKSLKKTKQSKLATIRSLSQNANRQLLCSKFSKILMSIIACKIKKQILPDVIVRKNEAELTNGINDLIEHILDQSDHKQFATYIRQIDCLLGLEDHI